MPWRHKLRDFIPPVLLPFARKFRFGREHNREWEYVPDGWAYAQKHPEVRGWNVPEILAVYKSKWPEFAHYVQGAGPLCVNHESLPIYDESAQKHNQVMTFAYALSLAARHRDRVKMLDWGGGSGHYYLLAQALLPDVKFDYHCRDLPLLCSFGAELFPGQSFFSDDRWQDDRFDFVVSSSSLQYAEAWAALLSDLCTVTHNLLFVSNLPIVQSVPSFVFIQRPYRFGYGTEYLGWCINEQELIRTATSSGLSLIRQFVNGLKPPIAGAPEQAMYRGYLFRRESEHGAQEIAR